MKEILFHALAICVLFGWVNMLLTQGVEAQTGARYSEPINISNTDNLSTLPIVAADHSGRLHVIWAETTNSDENSPTDTGYYTALVDGVWLDPVDVLAVQYGDSFNPYTLAVDSYGRLVLTWTQTRGVNVSTADTTMAGSAQAWSTTRLDVESPVNSADLAIDDSGIYHLVYVRNNRELVYVNSSGGVDDWSNPVTITAIDRDDEAILGPSIEVAEDGMVFVAWTKAAETENWGSVGVDFARSVDGGATWDPVQVIAGDGRLGYPDLLSDNEQNLHIFWLGSGNTGGRYHRWSDDRGVTWTDLIVAMRPEDITGFPGPPTLLLDSADTVHVIFAGRGQGGEKIWHSMWDGNGWRQPTPISGALPDSQAASATIGLGHQIHAAWVEYSSEDVWTTSFDTGSPPVTIDVIPQPEIIVPTPATSIVARQGESYTATATDNPAPQYPSMPTTPPAASNSMPLTLALALTPVMLLIIGVVVYSVRRK